jgi:hypothetical protein
MTQRGGWFSRGIYSLTVLTLLATALPAAAQNLPHKTRLRNGMILITKEAHSRDVLAVNVFVRGGAAVDPDNLPGLANFTQRMLLHVTTRRTGEQLAEPIEATGGAMYFLRLGVTGDASLTLDVTVHISMIKQFGNKPAATMPLLAGRSSAAPARPPAASSRPTTRRCWTTPTRT